MNIYVSFTLFSLMILIYWIITELFTMFFRFTGLPDEKARFQVISLLTGCGFTTRESEMMITSRARRRLARMTMLFGYVFNITIVSAFINVFFSLKAAEVKSSLAGLMIPLSVIVLMIYIIRNGRVRSLVVSYIERIAGRILRLDADNTTYPVDYIGEDSIAVVTLRKVPEELCELPLSRSGLKSEHGILVLLIERPGEKAGPVYGDTVLNHGDKLTVFGNYDTIRAVFRAKELFSD